MKEFGRFEGFSFIEIMISLTLFSVIVAGIFLAYAKIQKVAIEDQVRAEFSTQAILIKKKIQDDLSAHVGFSGNTTDSNHFEGRRVYGLLPTPFNDPIAQARSSDGFEVFVFDTSNSTQQSFNITAVDCTAGVQNAVLTVTGDFRPLTSYSEDLFAISFNDDVELYSVRGSITYNGGANTSAVGANETMHLCGSTTLPGQTLSRVVRIKYELASTGGGRPVLTRTRAGVEEELSGDVASMQVVYIFDAPETPRAADCEAKSGLRWFDHPLLSALDQCTWGDVSSARFEIFFESVSEISSDLSQNFHTGANDHKARYLSTYQLTATPGTDD